MLNDSNSNSIISFADVGKIYLPANSVGLHHVSFSIADGEFVSIIGPSGCGKSTVLKIMAGLEQPTSGQVTKPHETSMVFQSGALFPWLTVFDNVALGLRALRFDDYKVKHETLKYIELTGLKNFIAKYPHELSGGQRQRVGIARALAVDPKVLLLDEPFSALDPKTTEELHQDLIKIWHETKQTIVLVSHLIEEAVSLADRVILMKNFTVDQIFPIDLPHPRREQGANFEHEVHKIRKEFFK